MSGTDRMFFESEQHLSRCPIEWNWDSFLNETQNQTQPESRPQESVIKPLRFVEFIKRTTSRTPFVANANGHEENVSGVLDSSGFTERNEELRSVRDVQRWASGYHW
jgi:hypothetical protein